MHPTPYLLFNGNCAEAMKFYETVLGGKLETLLTFGEQPTGELPPNVRKDRIMHAYLALPDGGAIMASDDESGAPYQGMHGFAVSMMFGRAEETRRVFEALAPGGTIMMPLGKTFWSELFGGLTDRFGTPWMLTTAPAPQ